MDRFEKFIQKNREAFDDQIPSKDLWTGIEKEVSTHSIVKWATLIYKVAAILIIVLGTGIGIRTLFNNNISEQSNNGLTTEVYETTIYYESQINQKKQQLFKLTSNIPEIRKEVDMDFDLLDSAMIEIKNDLKDNVANEEVIEAMIQNYRLKLQILEELLNYANHNEDEQKIETHEL